ncbi:MAG: hypothetical protein HYY92_01420 [Parcubacteria group bacterium]|nr:hypothetical protein [Parcubacteria group bacterium]
MAQHTRRFFFTVALVVTLLLAFIGCQPKKDDSLPNTENPPQETGTLGAAIVTLTYADTSGGGVIPALTVPIPEPDICTRANLYYVAVRENGDASPSYWAQLVCADAGVVGNGVSIPLPAGEYVLEAVAVRAVVSIGSGGTEGIPLRRFASEPAIYARGESHTFTILPNQKTLVPVELASSFWDMSFSDPQKEAALNGEPTGNTSIALRATVENFPRHPDGAYLAPQISLTPGDTWEPEGCDYSSYLGNIYALDEKTGGGYASFDCAVSFPTPAAGTTATIRSALFVWTYFYNPPEPPAGWVVLNALYGEEKMSFSF